MEFINAYVYMCTYVKVFRECGGTNVEEARSIVKVGNKERNSGETGSGGDSAISVDG